MVSNRLVTYAGFALILAWFLVQSCFMAGKIKPDWGPDEKQHFSRSLQWHENRDPFFKLDTSDLEKAELSTLPYFYYALMGTLLQIKPHIVESELYLRYVNSGIGAVFLWIVFLIAGEFSKSAPVMLSAVLLPANLLMFVFLSSMVSYDGLTNLFSALSFLFLVRFIKSNLPRDFYCLIIFILAGVLTKFTLVPYAGILFFIVILVLLVKKKMDFSLQFYRPNRWLLLINIILSILCFRLYGMNLIRYRTLVPGCLEILGEEKCSVPGSDLVRDRNFQKQFEGEKRVGFQEFIKRYFSQVEASVYGIMSHESLFRWENKDLKFYHLYGWFFVFCMILRFNKLYKNPLWWTALFIIVAYVAIAFYTNYQTYMKIGLLGLGLQGRYLFPVLSVATVLISYTILEHFKPYIQYLLLSVFAFFLIRNGFFYFTGHVPATWFR